METQQLKALNHLNYINKNMMNFSLNEKAKQLKRKCQQLREGEEGSQTYSELTVQRL